MHLLSSKTELILYHNSYPQNFKSNAAIQCFIYLVPKPNLLSTNETLKLLN